MVIYKKQRGVAIITAMLVVALGTITMVAISSRQQLDMQRERNETLIQDIRSFATSGERFAAALLFRDHDKGLRNNSDSFDDDWAQTIPPVPIDSLTMQGCIVDMQGRFNLNNVVNEEGVVSEFHYLQLKRLLDELNIDRTKAEAILDWVDKDFNATVPDGAEDDYYTGLEQGYRTTNGSFVSVSELQLVKGFSPLEAEEKEDYELLLKHVAALPTANGPTTINVNTATPEVMSSIGEALTGLGPDLSRWDTGAYEDYPACEDIFDLSADDGPDTLEQNRDVTPYESVQLFEADAAVESGATIAPAGTLSVDSSYFQLRINVSGEDITLSQYTLLERDAEGRSRVIYRSRDTL